MKISNEDSRKHLEHMHQELKDGIERSCYLCTIVSPTCESCKRNTTGSFGALSFVGWRFDVDGRDFCERCDPYAEAVQRAADALEFIPYGEIIEFDDLVNGITLK